MVPVELPVLGSELVSVAITILVRVLSLRGGSELVPVLLVVELVPVILLIQGRELVPVGLLILEGKLVLR